MTLIIITTTNVTHTPIHTYTHTHSGDSPFKKSVKLNKRVYENEVIIPYLMLQKRKKKKLKTVIILHHSFHLLYYRGDFPFMKKASKVTAAAAAAAAAAADASKFMFDLMINFQELDFNKFIKLEKLVP
ncbi:hypothetical protein G9A89_019056 [Geosiphon pyriformis]|nr:hypothetical protein G9A89_019056 [Geosiphon pyriformis]